MTLPWHDGKFSTNGMIFLFWLVDTDDRLLHPMGQYESVSPTPRQKGCRYGLGVNCGKHKGKLEEGAKAKHSRHGEEFHLFWLWGNSHHGYPTRIRAMYQLVIIMQVFGSNQKLAFAVVWLHMYYEGLVVRLTLRADTQV